jgi:6-phosphogluconolactonase
MEDRRIRICENLESLSMAAAQSFIQMSRESIDRKGSFIVALTGGRTTKTLFRTLSLSENAREVEWEKILFFWGDERVVPPDHPESNFGQAYQLLLSRVKARPENLFRIRGELTVDEAIEDYRIKLRENAANSLNWPRFDLVFLGLGLDGHIASILPGSITEQERISPVIATTFDYQDRPAGRVSLTPLVFNSAREILFLVSGKEKASILRRVLQGNGDPQDLPALRIHPQKGCVTWLVDEEAASLLPEDLRDRISSA